MAKRTFRTPAAAARVLAVQRANLLKARAEGKMTRLGVPNGSTRSRAEDARRNSMTDAERLLPLIAPEDPEETGWHAKEGREALLWTLAYALAETTHPRQRLSASKTVLMYSAVPPPAGCRQWTGRSSVEWLRQLALSEAGNQQRPNVARGDPL